jgi:hypothetical protein
MGVPEIVAPPFPPNMEQAGGLEVSIFGHCRFEADEVPPARAASHFLLDVPQGLELSRLMMRARPWRWCLLCPLGLPSALG